MIYYIHISLKEGRISMATKTAIKSTKHSTTTKYKANDIAEKVDRKMPTSLRKVHKAVKDMPIIGALASEFLGAFILTAVFVETQGNPLYIAFALIGIVLFTGSLTGANPAMTVGAFVTKKVTWMRALGYIIVQLLGASIAYLVLNTFLHAADSSAATAAGSAAPSLLHAAEIVKGKEWYLFFVELLGATVLALGIATAMNSKRQKLVASFAAGFGLLAALAIALTLCSPLAQMLTEQNVIQTFLNPAIAFAAQGLSWSVWPLSIYVLAPVLGGILGFLIHEFLKINNNLDCDCDNDSCNC